MSIEQAHIIDDLHKSNRRLVARTNIVRDLLEDGLHALRHGQTEVTAEMIERSIAYLHDLEK